MSELLHQLNVGDVICIPEMDVEERFLVISTEPLVNVSRITVDGDGHDELQAPGSLREDIRTFYLLEHWLVEQALSAWRRNSLFNNNERLESLIRAYYEQPPFDVPGV